MLIRSFASEDINEVSGQRSLGIYGVKRNIYVFTTREQYDLKNFTKAKACVINNVVYDSKFCYSHPLTIDGGVIIKTAVYFGDIITSFPGNIKTNNAFFVIDNATTSERLRLPSGDETVTFSPGTWSRRIIQMDPADISDYMGISPANEVITISPEFYTDYDQNIKTGDFIDLMYSEDYRITMDKLIDANTTIVYMDIAKYDTMRLEINRQLHKAESVCDSSFNFSNGLKSAFNSYVGQGTTFIYDSDAQGFGKEGVMVRGGSIPFGKHYHQKYLFDNLNGTIDLFKNECKDIEGVVGHVRVMYNPTSIGDKMKIRFKDYKQSPITVLSQVNNDGSVNINLSNSSPVSSIDNGYSTDSYMKETLDLQYQNSINNFQKRNVYEVIMLIKPFDTLEEVTPKKYSRGYIKRGNSLVRKRIATNSSGFARVEELEIDPNKHIISKKCSFGEFSNYDMGRFINVYSGVKSICDLNSGKLLTYDLHAPIPNNNNCITYQSIGYPLEDQIEVKDYDSIYVTDYVNSKEPSFNYEGINETIWSYENCLQMAYPEVVGLLDSFFSSWGFDYPFDSTVIIDTKTNSFNVPKFSYLKGLLDEDTMLKIFALYAKEISKLTDIICKNSEFNKRNFRIKVFTNAFMTVIRVNDIDHKEIQIDFNTANCDHVNSLINNCVSDKKYLFSEEAGCILVGHNGNIESDLLGTIDYINGIEPY